MAATRCVHTYISISSQPYASSSLASISFVRHEKCLPSSAKVSDSRYLAQP